MKYSEVSEALEEWRRAPQGARGLKFKKRRNDIYFPGRAPQGARGLKSVLCGHKHRFRRSRPARGAWVEM